MAPKKTLAETLSSAPDASGRRLLFPRKVIYEDAEKLGIRCFNQMRSTGLKCLMDMNEKIYPSLVREFFSSLKFKENLLEAKFSLRGISGSLSEENLGSIIGYEPNSASVRVFDNISFEGYDKKKAIFLLTGMSLPSVPYHSLDLESKIMFHALTHLITPKFFKQNSPNSREIFYLWCIKNGYILNAPFIILSHMKAVVNGDVKDISYGMVVTMVAKHFGVTISDDEEVVEIGLKNSYDSKHLMSFMAKSGVAIGKEISDDDKSSEEKIPKEKPEKKRKLVKDVGETTSKKKKSKGKEVLKRTRSPRKSLRLSKQEKKKDEDQRTIEELLIELEEEISAEGEKAEEKGEVVEEEERTEEEKEGQEKEEEKEVEKEKEKEIEEEKEEEGNEKEVTEEEPIEKNTEKPKDFLPKKSPLNKVEEESSSKGKEKVMFEEAEIKTEYIDLVDIEDSFSMVKGFNLLSDQLSEMNRHLAKQTQLMEEGFKEISKSLSACEKVAENSFDTLADMESALKMKKMVDADHQDRMFDLLTRIFTRITEAASIREEKKTQMLKALKEETTKFNLKRNEVRTSTDTPSFSSEPKPIPSPMPKEPPPPVKPSTSIIPYHPPSSSVPPKP